MATALLWFYGRLAKTLHNELEIGRVLVRQHLAAMFEGIGERFADAEKPARGPEPE
jgi:hypothetical protein